MQECETREVCSFFTDKLETMPSIARTLKGKYCDSDKTLCARYMIKMKMRQGYFFRSEALLDRMEQEITTMFPNDTHKANEIINMMVK
jgi:hypothetical protein